MYVSIPKNPSCAYVVVFFLYLSGDVICSKILVRIRVTSVARKVINESTKGNIPFVAPESWDCSNWPGILMTLEVAKTIMSMMILPINHDIIPHSEFSPISLNCICFGQNDIILWKVLRVIS